MTPPGGKILRINQFILAVNCIFALLLLTSYLAPVVSPAVFWPIAFLGLCYFVWFVVNTLFIIYWLFSSKKYYLISLVSILIGFKAIVSSFGFHKAMPGNVKKTVNAIRVMNYNVHDFNMGYSNEATTKPQILRLIAMEQPDVITFQEYFNWRKHERYQVTDSLKKILHTSYYYFVPSGSTDTYDIGMAIYSKFPIVSQNVIQEPGNNVHNLGIFVDIKAANKLFRVYCVHLQSMQFEQKDYNYVENNSVFGLLNKSAAFSVLNKLRAAFIKRSEQVKLIKQQVQKSPFPYIIIGDFNDTPTSYAVNQMKAGLKNAFNEKGSGFGQTFNGKIPNFQIDYIMVSPSFSVLNYRVVQKKLSDHNPVISDLLLN